MNLQSVIFNLTVTTLLSGMPNGLLAMNPQDDMSDNAKHSYDRKKEVSDSKKPRKNSQRSTANERNNSLAMFNLGHKYEYGDDGVNIDYQEAMRYYELAAASGECPIAISSLGLMYEYGKIDGGDIQKAIEHYREAAALNEPNAQWSLGVLYQDGVDGILEQDIEQAKNLLIAAANQGHAPAQFYLGNIYREEQRYKEAIELYTQAALQNNQFGQYNLGYMYENGLGTSVNYEEAEFWYRKAADQGHALAYCALGFMQHRGLIGRASIYLANKNYTQAMEIDSAKIIESLQNGNSDDLYVLGHIYQNGLGIDADIDEANRLFELANEKKKEEEALKQAENQQLGESLTISENRDGMEIEYESPSNEKLPSLADYYNLNFTIPENEELAIRENFYDAQLALHQAVATNENIEIDPLTNETIEMINIDDDNSDTISEDLFRQ